MILGSKNSCFKPKKDCFGVKIDWLKLSLCGFEPQLTNLEFIVYPPKLKNTKTTVIISIVNIGLITIYGLLIM